MSDSIPNSPVATIGGKNFPIDVVATVPVACLLSWDKWQRMNNSLNRLMGRTVRIADLYDYGDETELEECYGFRSSQLSICRRLMDLISLPFLPPSLPGDRWDEDDLDRLKKRLGHLRALLEKTQDANLEVWAENLREGYKNHGYLYPAYHPHIDEKSTKSSPGNLAEGECLKEDPQPVAEDSVSEDDLEGLPGKLRRRRLRQIKKGKTGNEKNFPPQTEEEKPDDTIIVSEPLPGNSPGEAGTDKKVVRLPLSLVKPNPHQPRTHFAGIEELSESIEGTGQLKPIDVFLVSDARPPFYIIRDGERRYRACCRSKVISTIEAVILGEIKEAEIPTLFLRSFIANWAQEGHTPMETANALNRLHQEGMPYAEIARLICKSYPWVTQYASLVNLIPPFQQMLEPGKQTKKGRLPVSGAIELSRLKRECQERAWSKLKRGSINLRRIKSLVAEELESGVSGRSGRIHNGTKKGKTPSHLFDTLESWITRLPDIAQLLNQPVDQIARALAPRSQSLPEEFRQNLRSTIRILAEVEEKMRRISVGETVAVENLNPQTATRVRSIV